MNPLQPEPPPSDSESLRPDATPLQRQTAIQYKPRVPPAGKRYDVKELRKHYINVYSRWSEAHDARLRELYLRGETMLILVQTFGRKKGAIISRRKLGLL